MSGRTTQSAARRPAPPGRKGSGGANGRAASGRRVSPGVIFLVVAIVGSLVYMAYTVTVRDTAQIPLLASGAVVLAIVFAALAAYSLRAVLRAGQDGRDRPGATRGSRRRRSGDGRGRIRSRGDHPVPGGERPVRPEATLLAGGCRRTLC